MTGQVVYITTVIYWVHIYVNITILSVSWPWSRKRKK